MMYILLMNLLTKVLAIAYGDAKAVGTSPFSCQRTNSNKDWL